MNNEARNRTIDVLRGFSAIAVTLFHFNEPYPPLPDVYHRVLKWGWLGVSVFFVISGFCIAATRQKDGLISFWFRRLARIYPPYWASVVVVLSIVILRIMTTGTNDIMKLPKGFGEWLYTIAALTSPASAVIGLNWVYWSLGYELAFYILMGLLVFRNSWILLSLFSFLAIFCSGYPFDQWGLFGLGAACYYYTKKQYWAAAIIGIICLIHIFARLSLAPALAGCFAALLILFPSTYILRSFFRPIMQVGLFSYSLYLVHVPIGCYLLPRYLHLRSENRFWPSVLQDLILFLGSILFAILFYRLIEKPSHKLARRATQGGEKAPLGLAS